MKWKRFNHLVVMIVKENCRLVSLEGQLVPATDDIIGCVAHDQGHVAAKIIEAHNAAIDKMHGELNDIKKYVNQCADAGERVRLG